MTKQSYKIVSYKSSQYLFLFSIRATLFSLLHDFNCFSLDIASYIFSYISKYTSLFIWYLFVNPSMSSLLCSYILFIKFDVTQIYKTPFLLLASIYTYPFLLMFFKKITSLLSRLVMTTSGLLHPQRYLVFHPAGTYAGHFWSLAIKALMPACDVQKRVVLWVILCIHISSQISPQASSQ